MNGDPSAHCRFSFVLLKGTLSLMEIHSSEFDELARRHRKIVALYSVAKAINQPLPLQEIMDQAIVKVTELMETKAGGIRLLNQETGELPIVSSRGLTPKQI
jgi:hypothetical protein